VESHFIYCLPYNVDDLLNEIENSQIDCQFLGMHMGCIICTADDILGPILLSASVYGLQHVLDYAQKHQLVFNCGKSVCMKVGCSYKYNITNMVNCEVDSAIYIGITFHRGASLSVDFTDIKRKFYVACNSVLGRCK